MPTWYTQSGNPTPGADLSSSDIRAEFALIEAGLSDKLPTGGAAGAIVILSSDGESLELSSTLGQTNPNETDVEGVFYEVLDDDNTFMGFEAGSSAVTANNNTCIGYQSGAAIDSGADNTFVGYQSGSVTILGIRNTFIGSGAGVAAVGVDDDTLIGYQAGYQITSGDANICMGFRAGGTLTTGSNNTCLGYAADVTTGTQTNSIAIGYSVTTSASNTAQLGNSDITDTILRGRLRVDDATAPTGGDAMLVLPESASAVTAVSSNTMALYTEDDGSGASILCFHGTGDGGVSSTSPTSPDRTVAIKVNNTILYFHAKTTND